MKTLIRRSVGSQLRHSIYYNCMYQVIRQKRTFASIKRTNTTPEIYDLVCVGGGPAGLSLVTALRSNPSTSRLKTLLIESSPLSISPIHPEWRPDPNHYSNRCSSLTSASIAFLERIGVWKYVKKERVVPYECMQVWDGIGGGRIEFDWNGSGIPSPAIEQGTTIAWMNENLNLTNALLERLGELGGVEVTGGTKVSTITHGHEHGSLDLTEWPIVTLSDGREIAARLLVGADGVNSPVRHFADIESRGWDYDRHGVVATLRLSSAPTESSTSMVAKKRRTAYQRFLPTGPIALLPLPDNHATLVWSTLPSLAGHLKSLSVEDFLAMVNAAFRLSYTDIKYLHTLPSSQVSELEWRLKNTPFSIDKTPDPVISVQANSITSFPIRFRHADTYIAPRIALVGDAAHTIHPLAGQGLNLGQGDVEALVGRLVWAVERGADIGDVETVLQGYVRDRYAGNHVLGGMVDKLHKGFSFQKGPVVWARSWGLGVVDGLEVVKSWLMRRAGGGGGGTV